MRPVLCLVSAVLAALTFSQSASAITFGISEQNPRVFADPLYKALGNDRMRYVAPWDALTNRSAASQKAAAEADLFINAARSQGAELLISFNPTAGSRCPGSPCKLPSVSAYTKAFKAWKKKYPFLKVISPWNEINHSSQPTAKGKKGITRAVEYAEAVRKNCRGCKIIVADLLDISNLFSARVKYLETFQETLAEKSPKLAKNPIWGLHNYSEMNRRKTTVTKKILKAVGKNKVWVTELGALAKFETSNGREIYPLDFERQKNRLEFMVKAHKSRALSKQIERVYFYHWQGVDLTNPSQRFDSGMVNFDGTPRPALAVLQSQKALFK